MDQDCIMNLLSAAGTLSYTFAHRRTVADCSDLSDVAWAALIEDYWSPSDQDRETAKFLTADATEQAALLADLAAAGVSNPTVEDIELTAQQKADVEASGVRSKKYVPGFLAACAAIRAESEAYTDTSVRAMAKAQFVQI